MLYAGHEDNTLYCKLCSRKYMVFPISVTLPNARCSFVAYIGTLGVKSCSESSYQYGSFGASKQQ